MKNKLLILIVLFLGCIISAHAQKKDYHTLLSSGTIPEDFLTMTNEDASDAADIHIKASDKRKTVQYKETFLAKSNWYLNRLLRGGAIIFNDSITNYVRDVADYILKDDPDLRDKLRFYTAKYPAVNAFSNDEGIIIFNTGLLAQLENEAQLAYVISHEIVHYVKKHGITGYVEERMVNDEISDYDSWSADERLYLAKNHRSREMEIEADQTGFERFYAKTGYDLTEAMGVMDVLQYAYLPFNEIKFSPSFLTNKHFSIPDGFMLEELTPISIGDDYDEDLSTHPKVRKRKADLERLINATDKTNKNDKFIISKDRFYRMRELARYETIRKHMVRADYPRAIYDSYVMMQDAPNDKFLRKIVAGALYGISIYKSTHTDSPVIEDHDDIEGESQQVYYMLDEMSDEWANVIALQYAWQLHKLYPEDRYVKDIIDHLLLNMIQEENMYLKDFYSKTKETLIAERDSLNSLPEGNKQEEKSKYDRIREKSKEIRLERGEEEYRFALVSMMNDPKFLKAFQEAEKVAEKAEEQDDVTYADIKKEMQEEDENKGARLGMDRVLMIDPLFVSMDKRKDEEIKFFHSEKMQQKISNSIRGYGRELNLDIVMLDPWSLHNDEVETYNDIMLTKDWVTEFFNHDEVELIPFTSNDIYPLLEKYDTKYLNWMGALSVRKSGDGKFITGCGMLALGLVPFAIYQWVKPEYSMLIFDMLIDVENAELEFTYKHTTDHKGGSVRLNNRIYDILNQIQADEK